MASHAGIPALRKLSCGVGSRYTGGTVCQRQASDAVIPALFSNAYWHRNARVIEIQTRQQLKNNFFHETQRIFLKKFWVWTPSMYELGAVIFQSYLFMLYILIDIRHFCLASITKFCDGGH